MEKLGHENAKPRTHPLLAQGVRKQLLKAPISPIVWPTAEAWWNLSQANDERQASETYRHRDNFAHDFPSDLCGPSPSQAVMPGRIRRPPPSKAQTWTCASHTQTGAGSRTFSVHIASKQLHHRNKHEHETKRNSAKDTATWLDASFDIHVEHAHTHTRHVPEILVCIYKQKT